MFTPFEDTFAGYSQNDASVDFYGRVNSLVGKDKVLLDLGAGRAAWYEKDPIDYRRNLRLMKGKFKKVYAVDVDDAVMKNAAADERICMSDGKIPLKNNSVDVIVCDFVLEHIENVDLFVSEASRVLKSGGWFCARTPHKYHYVSVAARIIGNAKHAKFLRYIQKGREAKDVFPTVYKLNTISAVKSAFPNYENKTFVYRADAAYFFGSRVIFHTQQTLHRVMPAFFSGNLFVFLRKK